MVDVQRESDTLLIEQYQGTRVEVPDNPVDASIQWGFRIKMDGKKLLITGGYIILDDGACRYHALATQRPLGDLRLSADRTNYLRIVADPKVPNGIDLFTMQEDPRTITGDPRADVDGFDPHRPWVVLAEFHPPDDNNDEWTVVRGDLNETSEIENAVLPISESQGREYIEPEGGPEPQPTGSLKKINLRNMRPGTVSPDSPGDNEPF